MPVLDYFWTENPTLSGYLWIAKLSIETIHYSLYIITPTLIHKWEEDHQSLSYAGGGQTFDQDSQKDHSFPLAALTDHTLCLIFLNQAKYLTCVST